jgi:enoyl-CoA hydratase/carnithine racemase
MTDHFRRHEADGVLTVTFTRDEKLNAVSDVMTDALRQAAADLGDRDDLRVLVINAEGRFFTAGIDIGGLSGAVTSGVARRRNYRRLHLLFDELEAIEKPVILAAQGPCLGFGVELSVSCDFRLASDRAYFALPEITNLAVLPGSGGISRLTRLVGPHWARWMALAAKQVPAEQAVTIGLVHQVVPEVELAATVDALAAHLAGLSREAVGLAKLAIDAAASSDRTTARDVDRIANTLLLNSEEHQQAIAAFAARRAKKQ